MVEQTALTLDILTAADIKIALHNAYQHGDWLGFDELRIGTGYGKDADQRIDFWAIDCLPSKRFHRIAYEIKVSRSDFLKELRSPLKRRYALLLSNEYYFIAPEGLIKPEELPIECGLKVIRRLSFQGATRLDIQTIHPAPWRDTPAPS